MNDLTVERRKNIVNIMSDNEEFIVIGLTGRVGAGCSEAAALFASTYQELELPWIQPGTQGLRSDEERDLRILQRYASAHWIKFDIIRTRDIISSFLLDDFDHFVSALLSIARHDKLDFQGKLSPISESDSQNSFIKKALYQTMKGEIHREYMKVQKYLGQKSAKFLSEREDVQSSPELREKIEQDALFCSLVKIMEATNADDITMTVLNEMIAYYTTSSSDKDCDLHLCMLVCNAIGTLYKKVNANDCKEERSRYLSGVENALSNVAALAAWIIIQSLEGDREPEESIWSYLKDINDDLEKQPLESRMDEKDPQKRDRFKRFVFVHNLVPCLGNAVHDFMRENKLPFTEIFQKYGNSIRCYGKIIFGKVDSIEKADDVYAIPRKIVRFIKALRHPFSDNDGRPVRIVIDSIKNALEATYLRQRYSSFYLFAISVDEDIRKKRLMNSEKKSLTMEKIRMIDWNEYSSDGCEIYLHYDKKQNDGTLSDKDFSLERKFYDLTANEDCPEKFDYVRQYAYQGKLQQFYLQDVSASIASADVFISNNYENTAGKNMHLLWAIVRNVSLIMFPGLLLPTPIEQCMQIAFAAKCNSGCLSRQVGAVVTDSDYNVLSIGCNDVPCGDISCARKNLVDLCKLEDQAAYTKYELTNPEFRAQIRKFQYRNKDLNKTLRGLPMRYCFKDIHIKGKGHEKNPMRSRAMHAEEKALSACDSRCNGGYLFTTSSPCEMCSKNAKNHKIKKIYYIEVYPGISESQYSDSGDPDNIAEHILFTGAIGRAYTQMYTPIMPQKDILELLGVYDEYWVDDII